MVHFPESGSLLEKEYQQFLMLLGRDRTLTYEPLNRKVLTNVSRIHGRHPGGFV